MMGDWIGRRPAYCLLCMLSLALGLDALFLGNTELRTGDAVLDVHRRAR